MDVLEGDSLINNNQILLLLSNFRYLFKDLSNNSDVIIKELCIPSQSKHMIFPCDTIDLRKILFNRKIEFNEFVPLFSQNFANKFLKRYPIFLVIDNSKIDTDIFKNSSLYVIKESELDIRNSLVRITINDSFDSRVLKVVENIIKSLNENIECVVSNNIPGISSPDPKLSHSGVKKVAEKINIMKIMMEDNPEIPLRKIFESGLYKEIFNLAEIKDLQKDGIKMEQKTPYHKYNLLDHTVSVVKNLNQIMKNNKKNDKIRGLANLAATLHDFGKMKKSIQTIHPKDSERMQYIGHELESVKMADSILNFIGIEENDKNIVKKMIKLHMRPHGADKWRERGKRKFAEATKLDGCKDLWKYVFYHAQADEMSSNVDNYDPEKTKNIFSDFKNFIDNQRIIKVNKNWYNKFKKSQVVEPRAVPVIREDPEIKKGPKVMSPQYYRGMKVRDRRKGMVNPQEFGVVDCISDNIVSIIWNPDKKDKKRKEKFDMIEDTEILSLIVAEI